MSKIEESPEIQLKALPVPVPIPVFEDEEIINPEVIIVLSRGRRILIAVCMMLVYFLGVSLRVLARELMAERDPWRCQSFSLYLVLNVIWESRQLRSNGLVWCCGQGRLIIHRSLQLLV